MNRTFQYRLYPNKEQADALATLLCQGRLLYNEALAHRKQVYRQTGQTLNYVSQWPRFREDRKGRPEDFGLLNATSVQCLLRRLDKTFAGFFRRVKEGTKPGFPRFKGANRFHSLEYRHGDGLSFRVDRLYVQHVGDIRIKLHRPCPEGCLKHVVISRKAGGRWFVSFQGDDGQPVPELKRGKAVGVDVGLHWLIALSTGQVIDNPRWLRYRLGQLRGAQRALARKRKGSHRFYECKRQVGRLYSKIERQRADFLHRLTFRLTRHFALIAVEDLNLSFLMRNRHLALSAHDASLGRFMAMLDYKAERAGCAVVAVDPKYTSQACSGCGRVKKKMLSQRWHSCCCGVELDRDVNAAVNILNKARCGPTGLNVDAIRSSVPRESRRL